MACGLWLGLGVDISSVWVELSREIKELKCSSLLDRLDKPEFHIRIYLQAKIVITLYACMFCTIVSLRVSSPVNACQEKDEEKKQSY